LHNFAEFVGLQLMPEGSAVLTWIVPSATANPWGDMNNHYRGCELRFSGVRILEITVSKAQMPPSENTTLAEISYVREHPQMTSVPDPVHYLFIKFNGGLSMKLDAAEAELRPLER
jgi:hypothetical protein